MKQPILHLLFFFGLLAIQAQTDRIEYKIDSIRNTLLRVKPSDSVFVAAQYFNIGELYRRQLLSDSAYFYFHKAEKIYRKFNYKFEIAATLHGIAVCQTYDKDYTGSETTSIEAITLLESLNENNDIKKYKAFINNNLGIVFNELEQFEASLEYHERALKLKKSLKGNFKKSIGLSENNIAFTLKKSGAYSLALEKYSAILKNSSLLKQNPSFHALVLGNYANTLFLSEKLEKLPQLYLQALHMLDSVKDTYNSIIIHQHLAEYYNHFNKKEAAKYYAYKAKNISENYNNADLLKSLLLISEIEEGAVSNIFLKDYIRLSDSLQKSERFKRDKFARIRYETNKVEKENIQIAKERMWFLIISIILVVVSIFLYITITQRNRNRELRFIQQEKETTENIYNLMLSQNESIEEARDLEKKRISQELHDGVLGRLFGTRLSLESLNMSSGHEVVKAREQYLKELKTIEEDVRKVSHELSIDFISGRGFIDIIKSLLCKQSTAYKFACKLHYDDFIAWDAVSNKKKIHIYRIIQETLLNIYKHAKASKVNISFKLKSDTICLTILDDGSGFDINKAKSGIGLKNMKARMNEIKGTMQLVSEKELGTKVIIKVPID